MGGTEGQTVLDSIERPSDLRKLSTSELEELAAEIRSVGLDGPGIAATALTALGAEQVVARA